MLQKTNIKHFINFIMLRKKVANLEKKVSL